MWQTLKTSVVRTLAFKSKADSKGVGIFPTVLLIQFCCSDLCAAWHKWGFSSKWAYGNSLCHIGASSFTSSWVLFHFRTVLTPPKIHLPPSRLMLSVPLAYIRLYTYADLGMNSQMLQRFLKYRSERWESAFIRCAWRSFKWCGGVKVTL